MNLVAIVVVTVVAFILGGIYYAVLGRQLATASAAAAEASMKPWQVAVELGRCAVLTVVIACLVSWIDADGWVDGLRLGLVLWVGFPFVLWTGALLHAGEPLKAAVIHAGDWLIKLPVIAIILSVWQ